MMIIQFFILFLLLTLGACSVSNQTERKIENLDLDYDILATLPKKNISYQHSIKAILARRCMVCHGCYDAPCQLKLTSNEGLTRGATKEPVYNPLRIKKSQPSRLFIDAHSTVQWREKGFFAVINEDYVSKLASKTSYQTKSKEKTSIQQSNTQAENNLKNSLLYRIINLKQAFPQAKIGKLSSDINLSLEANRQCPTLAEFNDFALMHPSWGMPYGLPNLTDNEYKLLVQWLAQGSPIDKTEPIDNALKKQIKQWEAFLNQDNMKQRLVSRYLYEHLFLGHLYFENSPDIFFRLIRSKTATGEAIKEIATTRPYDSPGKMPFYYRLTPVLSQTMIKNHTIYLLSAQKLQRFKDLFIKTDYQVKELPSYQATIASNPFKVFKDIPPISRYQFLLDNAHFFMQSFIKGPVCRGQISLNVIDDYFWVVFMNPKKKLASLDSNFLIKNSNYFQLPADKEDTLNIPSIWTYYWKNQKKYIKEKIKQFKQLGTLSLNQAMDYIYTGNKNHANASLTIFRHLDSASVSYGLIGDDIKNSPKTTLLIDYPVFERIYYLLVAGFNVYGNLGHQLNTRLYMEFLRMEAEDNFLAFIPTSSRKKIRDSWYKGMRELVSKNFKAPMDWLFIEVVTGYQSNQPKLELYQKLKTLFKETENLALQYNKGKNLNKLQALSTEQQQKLKQFSKKINTLRGDKLQFIPDVTFLRIQMPNANDNQAFTIINNKAYKNLHSLFENEEKADKRDYQYDTLTLVNWLEGSYPNFFLDVKIDDIEHFSKQFKQIKDQTDYKKFIAIYGIRRTNSKFWEISDWFHNYYKKAHPIKAALFDLNRYENR